MGILFLHVLVFDLVNIVTDELGSVVAGSEGHIADVLRHIIDAVRNNQTVRERREVMLKGPEPSVGQSLPSALEVPGNLFFLGVNAYNRKAYGLRFFATDAIRRTARSYPSPLPSAAPCRRNAPEVQGNQGLACVHLECRGSTLFRPAPVLRIRPAPGPSRERSSCLPFCRVCVLVSIILLTLR